MVVLKRLTRALPLLLSLALAGTPVWPAFGMAAKPAAAAHAQHAQHAGMSHEQPAAPADDNGKTDCLQHDTCHGQCCAVCAQCFSAAPAMVSDPDRLQPVQTPIVPRLPDCLMAAAHNRPPQA